MNKRLFSMILCLIMVLSTASMMFACDNGGGGGAESTEPYETQIQQGSEHDPKIPAKDYGEYGFTFITEDGDYYVNYIDSDGSSSELIPDAVYRRNTVIEDKYNVTIEQVEATSMSSEIRTQVMSGTTEFDAIIARANILSVLAKEELLYDLNSVPQFNMDAPYWDQNAKTELAMGNKLYYTNCDINIRATPFMIYFNKQIIEDYQLTSPYEYMANDQWTLDNFAALIKAVSRDMDNDGSWTEFDQYGAYLEHHNVSTLLYGSGIRATTNDSTGYPTLTLTGDKLVTAYEKIKEIFSDKTTTFCITCSSLDPHGYDHKFDYARYLFTQDQALFHIAPSDVIPQFADMEHEFGIVPVPKFDSTQPRYYSLFSYYEVLVALPSIIPDLERTGSILEDMNYYSSIITIPVWFETMLSRKYTRDDESEANLSIVKETAVYDVGLFYDFGGMRSKIIDVDPAKNNISTNLAKMKKVIQAEIDDAFGDLAS
ncbi:MAG: extracellular solute-binding protein [Ruminococcaceae bacterium]|nr:extracellular solute-binding protein [Oscillospiraceae bacterium]